MKEFEKKILKYLVLLIGLTLFQYLNVIFLQKVIDFDQFSDFGMNYFLSISSLNFLLNGIFAIILYLDCRNKARNYYLIPLLALFAPLVGVMLFFIENYSLQKNNYNG